MKTILFRISLAGMMAAAAFHAQSLRSVEGSASLDSTAPPPARYSVARPRRVGRDVQYCVWH